MIARDVMTSNPKCCTPETSLQDAARLMLEIDCGELPVVEHAKSKKLVGVITDRDICCRGVAQGKDPIRSSVGECMSSPAVTVKQDTPIEECCRLMENKQIRRLPVVDSAGSCCGIVSQADIADQAEDQLVGEVVREISRPSHFATRAGNF